MFERTVLKMAGLLVVYSYCIVLSREKKKTIAKFKAQYQTNTGTRRRYGTDEQTDMWAGARAPGRTPEKPPHQEL